MLVFPEDLVASQRYEELMAYLGTTLGQGKSSLPSKELLQFHKRRSLRLAGPLTHAVILVQQDIDQQLSDEHSVTMHGLFQSSADVVLRDLETWPCFS